MMRMWEKKNVCDLYPSGKRMRFICVGQFIWQAFDMYSSCCMSTSGSRDLHSFFSLYIPMRTDFCWNQEKMHFCTHSGKKLMKKKRSLFYSLGEQPKLIAKSEKGKRYRVMHWCKAFFCNVRLKLLQCLMDILVFHVCKFIHCNVFLVQFSKCIHFSPYTYPIPLPLRLQYDFLVWIFA